jgi:hypothetical protein
MTRTVTDLARQIGTAQGVYDASMDGADCADLRDSFVILASVMADEYAAIHCDTAGQPAFAAAFLKGWSEAFEAGRA